MALGPGTILAQKYRLEARVASGGMGSVWSAVDVQLDRRVAVKLIVESMSDLPDVRARFLREAQAAGKLKSPYVVQVLDYGLEGSTPFMVLEWLDGEDLGRRLKRVGRLPLGEVAALLKQLGKGLRRAHEAGLVHRDIKPPNLFLVRHDEDETLKILDFGIAKGASIKAGEDTTTGVVVGSLRYMSPEQARGLRGVDHRAVVWSVGVVVYQALTGALPFEGEGDADLLVKLCTEQAKLPSARDPELARFDPFFARCFDRDIEKRFANIDDLVVELHRTAGLELPPPRVQDPTQSFDPTTSGEFSASSRSRGAITADPIQATLRGSSVSLKPRAPLKSWAIFGGALGVVLAVGALIVLTERAGDGTKSAANEAIGDARAAAAPTAEPGPSTTVTAVAEATATAAPSTSAPSASASTADPSATSVAAGAPPGAAPRTPPRPGGAKRPAIPTNPY